VSFGVSFPAGGVDIVIYLYEWFDLQLSALKSIPELTFG
jgi:hypothetical protein